MCFLDAVSHLKIMNIKILEYSIGYTKSKMAVQFLNMKT